MPVGQLTRETVGALEGLGRKIGRAIQGHQELIPEPPETVQQGTLGKTCKDVNKDGVAITRSHRIEQGADRVIAGNLRDATQRGGVMAPLVFLEPALGLYKRGRLGKEDTKCASSSSWYTVSCIAALTTVGQLRDPLLQDSPELLDA